MKLLQFQEKGDSSRRVRLGAMTSNDTLCELSFGGTMRELIAQLDRSASLREKLEDELKQANNLRLLQEVTLCAPLTDPEKLIFVGLNYLDHAAESNMKVPEKPVLFPKYNNSIIGPEAAVIIPREVKECDYEVELAVIIGRTAKHVPEAEAMLYVFGYTIINDVSARDIQLHEGQWTRGKAIDTFAPMGPWIVSANEIDNPAELNISLRLNGEIMQSSNTLHLIFNIPYLISFISRTITLQPGDVISTGTPPGVGMGKNPQVWLHHGDVTEAFIQGIGTLRSSYVAE